MMRWGLVVGALFTATAVAQDVPASVELRMEGCAEELQSLLATELRADGVRRIVAEDQDALARIELQGCASESVEVRIVDRSTAKQLQRLVPMADVSVEARPRVLAIAVAGLLRASWAELMLPDAPEGEVDVPAEVRRAVARRAAEGLTIQGADLLDPPQPDGASTETETETETETRESFAEADADAESESDSDADAEAEAESESESESDSDADADAESESESDADAAASASSSWSWQLGGGASARVFFGPASGLGGGRVFSGYGPFRFGVSSEAGFARDDLGRVRHRLTLVEVDAEPLTHAFDSVTLAMRVRLAAGWARMRGSSGRGDVLSSSVDAFAFGGGVFGALRIPLGPVELDVELGLGAMTGPTAQADGRDVSGLDGLYTRLGVMVARRR